MVKEAVGEGSAKLFVEEYEHECDLGAFFGEPVGITFAVAFAAVRAPSFSAGRSVADSARSDRR